MLVYRAAKFDYSKLKFTPLPKPQGKRISHTYSQQFAAFDIETSRIKEIEQSIMYIWQLCITDNVVLYGRTWKEFINCLEEIKKQLNGLHLLIFVHNLPYEFTYLAGIYEFKNEEVFATKPRKVVKCSMYDCFEFRDSYTLTNLSLKKFTERFNVEHSKKSGESFNYDKFRKPWTTLSHKEFIYAVYDVLGLCEAIQKQLELFNDTLYTIPVTQTGYVRREVKEGMREYHFKVNDLYPPYTCYRLLKAAFRGGNTHGNRFYTGVVLKDVSSVDESSAYPFQQVCKKYPMTPFKEMPDTRLSYLEKMIDRNAAFVMQIEFTNIELNYKYWPVPYIPLAKCDIQTLGEYTLDNGRIISASRLRICITDIDYKIIASEYKWKRADIIALWQSYYDYLPAPIIETNLKYYNNKTKRKGIESEAVYYMRDKEMLNSIYGMSCQDPIQQNIMYNDGAFDSRLFVDENGFILDNIEREEYKYKEYSRRRLVAFQCYQWGVWTTARARECLETGIKIAGDNFVYCDTDSIKYLGGADFNGYNKEARALSKKRKAVAKDKNGILHYMGVFEKECTYSKFCQLGAKKYAYEMDGNLYVTISGVPKKAGAKELKQKGGIEAFAAAANPETPFLFSDIDKLESVYNDQDYGKYIIDGREIDITKNLYLRETTYKLSITNDYSDILSYSSKVLNLIEKFWLDCQFTK